MSHQWLIQKVLCIKRTENHPNPMLNQKNVSAPNQTRDSPQHNTTMPVNFCWVNPLSNWTDETPPHSLLLVLSHCSHAVSFCLSLPNTEPKIVKTQEWYTQFLSICPLHDLHPQPAGASGHHPVEQFVTGRNPQHPHCVLTKPHLIPLFHL